MTLFNAITRLRALDVDPDTLAKINSIIKEELSNTKEYKKLEEKTCSIINRRGKRAGERCGVACVSGYDQCIKHLAPKEPRSPEQRSQTAKVKKDAFIKWINSPHAAKFEMEDSGKKYNAPSEDAIDSELLFIKRCLGKQVFEELSDVYKEMRLTNPNTLIKLKQEFRYKLDVNDILVCYANEEDASKRNTQKMKEAGIMKKCVANPSGKRSCLL